MKAISNEEGLKHYGVPGMKWGHRKAQGQPTPSNRTRRLASAIKNADRDIKSFPKGAYKDKKGRVLLTAKDMKDITKDLIKGREKLKVKLIKSQYADEYMAGLSTAGKIYAKVTAGDKIYANTMYDLNKAFPNEE